MHPALLAAAGIGILVAQSALPGGASWMLRGLAIAVAVLCLVAALGAWASRRRASALPLPDGPLRHIDPASAASHAGGISLSLQRLHEFHPWLATGDAGRYPEDAAFCADLGRETALRLLQEHLACGDCRGAVVAGIGPSGLIIAAYSDDFDACVFLYALPELAERLIRRHRLQRGTRLVVCNTFTPPGDGRSLQEDIRIGERADASPWVGVWPLVVDFLSEDAQRIRALHEGIGGDEWARVEELAAAAQPDGIRLRRIEPLRCLHAGVRID